MSKARAIGKFPVTVGRRFVLDIPYGKILAIGRQLKSVTLDTDTNFPDDLFVWVEYQPGWPSDRRSFETFTDGQSIPDDVEHRATYADMLFVWHLYEYA